METREKTKRREGLTSVQVQSDLAKKLAYYVKQGYSKTEIINEALRQYLIERELQEVRQKLIPIAQARGIYTDEDVERALG